MLSLSAPATASGPPAPSGVAYTAFPEYVPESPSVFSDGGQYPGYVLSLAVIGGALALPPVTRATGVSSAQALGLIGLHFVVCSLNIWLVGPRARHSLPMFRFGVVVDLFIGLVVACGLPALGGTPNTMLWNLTILYACLNGAMDIRPSWFYLLAHSVFPLLTIPMFDWRSDPWGLAGPLLAASASAGSYHFMAKTTGAWRTIRQRQQVMLRQLADKNAHLERERLARDLHDSVGSTLGLLSLHADLLDRHRDDPEQVGRIASLARDAARGALDDLRGVFEAIAPEGRTLRELASALDALGRRCAPGVDVVIQVTNGQDSLLSNPTRLALVRFFQEAVRNAAVHGSAKRIDVTFAFSPAGGLAVAVVDDGGGFDPNDVVFGRGLKGMKARATELDGALEVEAVRGRGVRLSFSVPSEQALESA